MSMRPSHDWPRTRSARCGGDRSVTERPLELVILHVRLPEFDGVEAAGLAGTVAAGEPRALVDADVDVAGPLRTILDEGVVPEAPFWVGTIRGAFAGLQVSPATRDETVGV